MKVLWILEKEVWTKDEHLALEQALTAEGMEILHHEIGQTVTDLDFTVNLSGNEKYEDIPVVGRGSINFIKNMAFGFPWAFVYWHEFRCSHYYTYLTEFLLNRRFIFLPWGLLTKQKNDYWGWLSEYQKVFIRPDTNDKIFTGKLIEWKDFEKWHETESVCYQPSPDLQCVVAHPEDIEYERRFICSVEECRILGSSVYNATDLNETIPPVCEKETQVVTKILERMKNTPEILGDLPFVVLDMAATQDEFKLVEIGSINCCSWYNCDARPIVRSVADHLERHW